MHWLIEGIIVNIIWIILIKIFKYLFTVFQTNNLMELNPKTLRIYFILYLTLLIFDSPLFFIGLMLYRNSFWKLLLSSFPFAFSVYNIVKIFNKFYNKSVENKISKRNSNSSNKKSKIFKK